MIKNGVDKCYTYSKLKSLVFINDCVLIMVGLSTHILQVCKLSTGDSLDMCPQDETCILANDATIVDMEVHL